MLVNTFVYEKKKSSFANFIQAQSDDALCEESAKRIENN